MGASIKKKQAVVIIHGIGEQIPMETLRGFVESVWTEDSSVRTKYGSSQVWSKPDEASKNYELRRLTTGRDKNGRRTDFFEFYWADLMEDTKLSQVWAWARVLLFRSPRSIPAPLLQLWLVLWGIVVLGALGALAYNLGWLKEWLAPWLGVTGVVGAIIWSLAAYFLVNVAGDAARYLHVAPVNIAGRRKIRQAGIELIKKLHDSSKYDRIILVGHSLGTVIGYDILTHLWPQYHDEHLEKAPADPSEVLMEIEQNAIKGCSADEFQNLQTNYFKEISSQGNKWLVTDFVTMGSPLTYAPLLLAKNGKQFDQKKGDREFPTCPPQLETNGEAKHFTFKGGNDKWIPHHAAVFAVTRWTNLYFPVKNTVRGDVIGGPLAPVLGKGIKDVEVSTGLQKGFLTHTLYWTIPAKDDGSTHIKELRKAVRFTS